MRKYYKTELHVHTSPASNCSDIEPQKLVEIYKENGYDSIVLTNHFIFEFMDRTQEENIEVFLKDYYECLEAGKRVGLNVILGAEIRFTENNNDYLIFGISPEDMADIYNMLPYGIDRFYKEYKNHKNVIIQAHPYRNGMESVNRESIDGVEAFNVHPHHNSRVGTAAKYAFENDMIVTCGNDFHHYGHECLCGILTKKPLKDSYDVAKVLKKRKYKMTIGGYILNI